MLLSIRLLHPPPTEWLPWIDPERPQFCGGLDPFAQRVGAAFGEFLAGKQGGAVPLLKDAHRLSHCHPSICTVGWGTVFERSGSAGAEDQGIMFGIKGLRWAVRMRMEALDQQKAESARQNLEPFLLSPRGFDCTPQCPIDQPPYSIIPLRQAVCTRDVFKNGCQGKVVFSSRIVAREPRRDIA